MHTKTPRFQLAHLGSVWNDHVSSVQTVDYVTMARRGTWLTLVPFAICAALVAFKLE